MVKGQHGGSMAAILNNGEFFIHIPKTGGTFVKRVLNTLDLTKEHVNLSSSHCTTRIMKEHFQWGENYPFIFCFVRHPITWYESYYAFMYQKRLKPLKQFVYKQKNYPLLILEDFLVNCFSEGVLSFDKFLRFIINNRPGFVTELYSCYDTFECSFVGKQENLDKDLSKVLELMGYGYHYETIKHFRIINKTPPLDIKWDKGLKREILATEIACLRRYNYENS